MTTANPVSPTLREPHLLGHGLREDLLQRGQRLPRADAAGRGAVDLHRAQQVETRDDLTAVR